MFFNFKKSTASLSMKEAAGELAKDKSIYLLDVRTKEEYAGGHIPGSVNVPLNEIQKVEKLVPEKDARVFVYCQGGGRSRQAGSVMAKMGYTNVTNIGGIVQWRGNLERKVSS